MQNNNEGLILKKCFTGTAINTKKIKITAQKPYKNTRVQLQKYHKLIVIK